ncbi:Proline-specific permease [Beauveria bassiana]|nr:Proline-specific permease [Beauveria bassiana]KAH8720621.1 Proline-specific permease [Beauveria bassiana]
MKGDNHQPSLAAAAEQLSPSSPVPGSEKQHLSSDEEVCKPATSLGAGASESTRRGLKSRHAQMIALGGSIGTGLFVGSGQGLKMGGPAFLLVCYSIITLLLYGVATGVGEISAYLPVRGSGVAYYGHRFPLYFTNWAHPGPVNTYLVDGGVGRLCAFLGTLTFSVYAFIFAPEMLVATAGEMQSPRRNMPKATKRYFWRLVIFYLLGVLAIGILVRSDNAGLLSPGNTAAASPWALGIKAAGIPVLDSIINAVIVLSAWSTGNSFLYVASRALYSLALSGNAPRIFARCTKHGIPHYATALSACFAALAYMNLGSTGSVVFNWLVNIVNTGAFQSWICCCFIYLRFYKAAELQNVTVANGQLPYRSRFQPYAAWISGIVFSVLLLLNGFKVFVKGNWDTPTFITSYIGIAIFAALFLGHKFTIGRKDPWMVPLHEMDLYTGLEDVLAAELPPPPPIKWWQVWRILFE